MSHQQISPRFSLGALGGSLNRDPCSLWYYRDYPQREKERETERKYIGGLEDYIWGI